MNKHKTGLMVERTLPWHYYLIIFIILIGLCGAVFAHGQPVHAQSESTLSVSQPTGNLIINGQNALTLELLVTNAVELRGFDLTITYDPEIVQLESWAHGGMLSPVMKMTEINSPGSLRLAVVQFGGESQSGDGVLLYLIFSGLAPGTSPITIESATFTNDMGDKTYPTLEHGSLIAAYDPALLEQFPLTGEIFLQGQVNRGDVPVTLEEGAVYQVGPYAATSLDQPGSNLDFGDVAADTYRITTAQPRYLNLTTGLDKDITLSGSGTVISPLVLVSGNAVWTDNVIDAADASLVGASYGLTLSDLAPGETLDADVNFDGVVNLRDLALVAGNFDLTSALAYESWSP